MLFNPSGFSNDGFALLCPIKKDTIDLRSLKYTRHTVKETSSPIGSTFEECKKASTTRITSSELIDINGDVTIVINSDSIKAFVLVFDEKGLYTGKYFGWVTKNNPLKLTETAKISITLATTTNAEITPAYITYSDSEIAVCKFSKYSLELPIIESSLMDESGREYDAVAQNWYASWPYLIQFYMYDMPARPISSNKLKELSVNNIKASMTHNIEFPSDNDLDELKLIKTAIGDGKIDEISVNIDTRLTKIKLLYRPE